MNARAHHFQMKYLLAQLALQNTTRFLARMRPGGDPRFLPDLWSAVGRDLEPAERLPSTGAAVWHRGTPGEEGELVVLTFPTPASPGEAYFVGLLMHRQRGRVFCLEHMSHPVTPACGAMLVELSMNSRCHLGPLGAASLEAFVAAIDRTVQDERAAPDALTPFQAPLAGRLRPADQP